MVPLTGSFTGVMALQALLQFTGSHCQTLNLFMYCDTAPAFRS